MQFYHLDIGRLPTVRRFRENRAMPVIKHAGLLFVTSASHITAWLDRTLFEIRGLRSYDSMAATSRCKSGCNWQRVTREGWVDHALSSLGWYPWQCQDCRNCSHFRIRS